MPIETPQTLDPVVESKKVQRTFEVVITATYTDAAPNVPIFNVLYGVENVAYKRTQSGAVEIRKSEPSILPNAYPALAAFTQGGKTGVQILTFLMNFGDTLV